MSKFRSWLIVGWRFSRYVLYRLRLGRRPVFAGIYPEIMEVIGWFLRWPTHLRIVGAEHCPKEGPAAFAANHMKGDDPPTIYRSAYLASGRIIHPHFLGRRGIFSDAPLSGFLDYDELLELCGAVLFDRESVKLSQLKPIIKYLRGGECFAMHPARTRSRSGAIMEYLEGHEGPGGVAMFVAQAQRGHPDLAVHVVPMARTYNPATKRTTVVLGEPEYLPHGAKRDAQQALDEQIVLRIAEQAEVNAAQLVSAFLYVRCLHNRLDPIEATRLTEIVQSVAAGLTNRRMDPAIETDLQGEIEAVLRYLKDKGMIERDGHAIQPLRNAVLATPPLDREFRDKNPVKYLTNQILHFTDVTQAAEEAALLLP